MHRRHDVIQISEAFQTFLLLLLHHRLQGFVLSFLFQAIFCLRREMRKKKKRKEKDKSREAENINSEEKKKTKERKERTVATALGRSGWKRWNSRQRNESPHGKPIESARFSKHLCAKGKKEETIECMDE